MFPQLSTYADSKPGMSTTNNELFVRLWNELDIRRISFSASNRKEAENSRLKWFPYNKGGEYRKWYGNNDYVVDWENDGKRLKEYTKGASGGRMVSLEYFFLPCFTWSMISSRGTAFRYKKQGTILSNAAPAGFSKDMNYYLLGLLNSTIARRILQFISPTLNCTSGDIAKFPVKVENKETAESIVKENIRISQNDWDTFETSWDFQRHPLLPSPEKTEPSSAGEQTSDLDEKRMEFAVFCVENLAEDLGQDATAVFDLLTRESDLLYSYVIPCYEPLHSQDKAYILDDIKGVMRERGLLP